MSPFVIHLKNTDDSSVFIKRAAEVIIEGKLIGYPTNTVYGMGCDPLNNQAVKQIFFIKNRPSDMGLPVLVADLEEAEKFAEFSEVERTLAKKFWPGELTIIVPLKDPSDEAWLNVTGGRPTVAVRMPKNPIILAICQMLKKIYTLGAVIGTSANFSGQPSISDGKEMVETFSTMLEFIIDTGACVSKIPSTIVKIDREKVDDGQPPQEYVEVIREGTVSGEEIIKTLR